MLELAPFVIRSRHTSAAALAKRFGEVQIVNLTSRAEPPWVRFSPFYPHGNIPGPLTPGCTAASVEGLWQGLKVFEREDVDASKFDNATMKGLKRTVRRLGRCLGHRAGLGGDELLPDLQARHRIYLPAYRWVLEQCLAAEVEALRELARRHQTVVLLDYETNPEVDDPSRPLSHAALVARYVLDAWPTSLPLDS